MSMIPRIKSEGMLFGKPVPTPDQVEGRLFRIMPYGSTERWMKR